MPAVGLDRAGRHFAARVGGRGLGHRRGFGEPVRVGVGAPAGEGGRRPRLLGFEQHLGAAVGHGLEGAHGDPELLAVLDVGDRHLERPVAHAHELRADRHQRPVHARGHVSGKLVASLGPYPCGGAGGVDRLEWLRRRRRRRPPRAPGRRLRRARSRPPRRRSTTRSAEPSLALPSAPIDSPEASPGSHCSRCSGEPACSIRVEAIAEGRKGTGAIDRPSSSHRIESSIRAESAAAVLLGDRDPGPAELAQLVPQRLVGGAQLGVLADALGLCPLGQQGPGGALDLPLVVGEAEVHGTRRRPSAAAGRARARRRCS